MTLAEICVKRPVFSVMLIGFLVVLGIFSFRDLGVDLFPKADPATVFVSVRLPGAQPEEMVTQVVLPIEEALSTISGIDELRARTTEGTTTITVQFTLERDIEDAAQDVREKVAGAIRQLPPNVIPPVIQKADPDSEPVMTVAVASDRSLRETTEIADKQIRRILETVDGVGEVSMSGGRERQIRIYVDAERLSAYGVTINEVENAVRDENVESPGGRIIRGESEMDVRTMGRIDASSQFSDIIVTGRSLNLWSALGALLLLGIVKKNAILQIDYTNQLRREGMPLREAIVRANHVRLRPILMTTFSIVAGLIPTAIGIGAGAAQRSAIAVTIIGGQTLCLLLTLLVTPVAYSMLAGLEGVSMFARARARLSAVKSGIMKMFM